jgi:hypothetical protein
MAKAALEFMAMRLQEHNASLLDELVRDPQLDPIRNHARRGTIDSWPVSVRRIYKDSSRWISNDSQDFQLLNEADLLVTRRNEMYFVLAIFGIELVINIAGPDCEGYEEWLVEHSNVSPLYIGRNAHRWQLLC